MRIKILGQGCSKCVMLADNTRRALDNLGRDADIIKVTDIAEIAVRIARDPNDLMLVTAIRSAVYLEIGRAHV